MGRGHGNLTYRLAQVLTGHGVFGSYLARIGREATTECWFCGAPEDDVERTIAVFPTWDEHRQRLVGDIGPDLSIRGLVNALLRGPREWSAVSRFSEAVLRAKEDREREYEKSGFRRRMLRTIRIKIRSKDRLGFKRKINPADEEGEVEEMAEGEVLDLGHWPREKKRRCRNEEEENEDEDADDDDGVFDCRGAATNERFEEPKERMWSTNVFTFFFNLPLSSGGEVLV